MNHLKFHLQGARAMGSDFHPVEIARFHRLSSGAPGVLLGPLVVTHDAPAGASQLVLGGANGRAIVGQAPAGLLLRIDGQALRAEVAQAVNGSLLADLSVPLPFPVAAGASADLRSIAVSALRQADSQTRDGDRHVAESRYTFESLEAPREGDLVSIGDRRGVIARVIGIAGGWRIETLTEIRDRELVVRRPHGLTDGRRRVETVRLAADHPAGAVRVALKSTEGRPIVGTAPAGLRLRQVDEAGTAIVDGVSLEAFTPSHAAGVGGLDLELLASLDAALPEGTLPEGTLFALESPSGRIPSRFRWARMKVDNPGAAPDHVAQYSFAPDVSIALGDEVSDELIREGEGVVISIEDDPLGRVVEVRF